MMFNMIIEKTILEKYFMKKMEKQTKNIYLLIKETITEHTLKRLIPAKAEVAPWI